MTPNQQIEQLAKSHERFVKSAQFMLGAGNSMLAEDVVQECYLKILMMLRKNPDKRVNENYMITTIKFFIMDDHKKKTDPMKYALPIKDIAQEDEDQKEKPNPEQVMKDIDEVVETFYHFDKLLFNAYRYEFRSIRKLSKATNIGHVQVFKTVKRCKEEIRSKLKFKYYGKE